MNRISGIPETQTVRHSIRFVTQVQDGAAVLMRFRVPEPAYAILLADAQQHTETAPERSALDITLHLSPDPDSGASLTSEWYEEIGLQEQQATVDVRLRDARLLWRPGRALLLCTAERSSSLVDAIVEFAYFEAFLRQIENEIAERWTQLDEDRPLAFDVTRHDLKRSRIVGERMRLLFEDRARFARAESSLSCPGSEVPFSARKLGAKLRKAASIEPRLAAVDGQLEVFEHVYEMASQRMGEARAAYQTQIVEWIIIALLAGEVLLMLLDSLLKHSILG